jgi:tight adherence protein C
MMLDDVTRMLLPGAIFLGATAIIILVGSAVVGRDRRAVGRMRRLGRPHPSDSSLPTSPRGLESLLTPEIAYTFHSLGSDRIQSQLHKAGIYDSKAIQQFRMAQIACIAIPVVACLSCQSLGVTTWSRSVMFGAGGVVIGACLPLLWIRHVKGMRQARLRKSLPDFLDLTVTCLEAGLGIQAALREVATELRTAHPELCDELSIALSELELGKGLEEALRNFAERADLEELRTLAAFVRHAMQFGTTMADAIRQLSDMLRNQRELRAEEIAQKAAVKILFPTLIFIFPTVFVVLVGPAAIQIHEGFRNQPTEVINHGNK